MSPESDISLAVSVSGVGVKYDLGLERARTLRRLVASVAARGRATPADDHSGADFWALHDVTFSVQPGEIVGLVGSNGAGKSTLLLTIAGILIPDTGHVTTHGKRATLLTVGAGFEPELTGRDNIVLNAAYLGLSRQAIRAQLESIIEFSELGQFIDVPLKKYSTGMRTRLGFSIVAHISPEILLIDEVLSVGDAHFQAKSRERLFQLMDAASAIMIVSHSTEFIASTCTKVLWLDRGAVKSYGAPTEILPRYLEESSRNTKAGGPEAAAGSA